MRCLWSCYLARKPAVPLRTPARLNLDSPGSAGELRDGRVDENVPECHRLSQLGKDSSDVDAGHVAEHRQQVDPRRINQPLSIYSFPVRWQDRCSVGLQWRGTKSPKGIWSDFYCWMRCYVLPKINRLLNSHIDSLKTTDMNVSTKKKKSLELD